MLTTTPGQSGLKSADAPTQWKTVKKLFTVSLTQDISLRCGPTPSEIDLLAFLKAMSFSGILAEQFFLALDKDGDGLVGLEDFGDGVRVAFKGEVLETSELLFDLLDFNFKGYVTRDDVAYTFANLPKLCAKCNKELYPRLAESIEECFDRKPEMELEDLQKSLEVDSLMTSYLLRAIQSCFPACLRTLYSSLSPCCQKSPDSPSTLRPLKLDGVKYYGELTEDVLYCYNSVLRQTLKVAILLRDVYVETVDAVTFTLGNSQHAYSFSTDSTESREDWIALIHSQIAYRPFTLTYETLTQVGHGASGQVFKVLHKPTSSFAAVKIVSKSSLDRKAEIAIRREMQVLACTSHPNILTLLDVFETKSDILIVSELLTGGSLLDWLEAREFRVSEESAKQITLDMANGLMYLHSHGIVHRDIKLENVLLSNEGGQIRAKIIDFGLSCFLGPNQHTNDPVGTLKFAAPEILSRLKYREKVDSWSLGVILYVLLHRVMPFGGKTDEETALSILKRHLHFSGPHWASVSNEAILVVAGLLSRNPRSRMSVRELLESAWLRSNTQSF